MCISTTSDSLKWEVMVINKVIHRLRKIVEAPKPDSKSKLVINYTFLLLI